MTKTMAAWGVVILAMVLPVTEVAAEKKAQEQPVAVYVVQPQAEFVDAALQGRIDSTKDVESSLKYAFKKHVRMVGTREEAQIVVEVLGRAESDTETRRLTHNPINGFGSEALKAKTVVARMKVGDYETEILGRSAETQYSVGGYGGRWTDAATNVAYQIQEFIKTNRAKLQ